MSDDKQNIYDNWNFFLFVGLTWIYLIISVTFEHKNITFIHVTSVGIILGFLVGMIFHFASQGTYDYSNLKFNQQFFFFVVLPPIIYAGGYSLQVNKFLRGFLYILLFGVGTTLISFLITSLATILYTASNAVVNNGKVINIDIADSLLFSAAISSTDAVAALTMIDSIKYPKLFSIIFGESMVNDAVSIVIYISIHGLVGEIGKTFEWYEIFKILLQFIIIFFASISIGIVMGILSAIITKYFRFLNNHPIIELCTVFIFGYCSFILCQALDLSGVFAILVCGIFQNYYTSKNLSTTGKISMKVILEFLAILAEGFLYIYIGLSAWYYEGPIETSNIEIQRPWNIGFIIFELFMTFISRFIGIFGLSYLVSKCKKKNWQINKWELSIIYFAGLIRGAIAYALIQNDTGISNTGTKVVKSTVYFIVVITTITMGSFVPFWIRFSLKKMVKQQNQNSLEQKLNDSINNKENNTNSINNNDQNQQNMVQNKINNSETTSNKNNIQKIDFNEEFNSIFKKFDQKYFQKWFTFDYKEDEKSKEEEEEALHQLTYRQYSTKKENKAEYQSLTQSKLGNMFQNQQKLYNSSINIQSNQTNNNNNYKENSNIDIQENKINNSSNININDTLELNKQYTTERFNNDIVQEDKLQSSFLHVQQSPPQDLESINKNINLELTEINNSQNNQSK